MNIQTCEININPLGLLPQRLKHPLLFVNINLPNTLPKLNNSPYLACEYKLHLSTQNLNGSPPLPCKIDINPKTLPTTEALSPPLYRGFNSPYFYEININPPRFQLALYPPRDFKQPSPPFCKYKFTQAQNP